VREIAPQLEAHADRSTTGAGIFLSLKAIHLGLQSVYKLSHTREEPKRFGVCTVSQDTEDGTLASFSPSHPEESPFPKSSASVGSIVQGDKSLTCDICAAIRPESLKILATGNNYDIRQAATRILVDRFLCIPSEYASLSADLFSADPTIRDIARRTVKMIERYADRSHIRRVEILKEQAGFQDARPSAPVPLPGALTDLEPRTQEVGIDFPPS